jgi:putative DNA primase/helicase
MSYTDVESATAKVDAFLKGKNVIALPVPEVSEKTAPVVFYSADGRMGIRHTNGRLPEILDAVGLALSASPNMNVFVHAGRLVRVHEVKNKSVGIHRPDGALVIHPLEASHLTELIGRAAMHVKYDLRSTDDASGKKGAWVNCDCPRRVSESYIARGYWPEIPVLSGFVEAPTIDHTGRLIDKRGYDSESGLYLAISDAVTDTYQSPTNKPSKSEAEKALKYLSELVESFPFVNDEDKSAIIAAIITAMVRRVLPSAPMFAVTAPMPGTGKTLLAETAAIIATGRRSSVLSLGHDDAEAEKRLGGVLLAGDAAILLDNIERPLGGDLLCQVTTQPSVRLRPLGVSSVISVPTHALMLATGNNLAIVGDLKRRVVLIRMDAKTERPEQRAFDRSHIDEVISKRGALISAALTIPMAYMAAGAPAIHGHRPFGSFELWDQMVRRPLLWLGYPDPLGGAEALRESDPDLEAMRALFSAWLEIPSLNKPCTVAEIIKVGMEYMLGGGDSACPELRDALQLVCSEKVNSRRLGIWLRNHRDRIVDGMQLIRAGDDGHAKVAMWRIVKCG